MIGGEKIKNLLEKIKETQGIDIKKLLTKKGREEVVLKDAVDILKSKGYEAKLIEKKKGYDIETNAPIEEKKEAIEESKELLKKLLKSTQSILKQKLGL